MNDNEKIANVIFRKVLGIDIDMEESFFDSGGDSLLVASLIVEYENMSKKPFDLDLFLEKPNKLSIVKMLESL